MGRIVYPFFIWYIDGVKSIRCVTIDVLGAPSISVTTEITVNPGP